jgi:hypothetical protein
MPKAEKLSAKAVAKHEAASGLSKAVALGVSPAISKALMGHFMQDPELGTQFGFGSGIGLATLNISFSAANNIIDAIEPQIAEFHNKDLISFLLHTSNVLFSSSCATAGFLGAAAFMNADTDQSGMDAEYVFPLFVFIAALRVLVQKASNPYLKKLGEATVQAGISIATGVSVGYTSDRLHAFLSASTALFTATATSAVATFIGSFFMSPMPEQQTSSETGKPLLMNDSADEENGKSPG